MDTQNQAVEADAAGLTPASWGYCIFCQRPILTSYYEIPVTRARRGQHAYIGRVHVACYNMRTLTGDDLIAARAALDASQNGIERLYARMVAVGQAVREAMR